MSQRGRWFGQAVRQDKDLDSTLGFVQQVLFELGAELATPPSVSGRAALWPLILLFFEK